VVHVEGEKHESVVFERLGNVGPLCDGKSGEGGRNGGALDGGIRQQILFYGLVILQDLLISDPDGEDLVLVETQVLVSDMTHLGGHHTRSDQEYDGDGELEYDQGPAHPETGSAFQPSRPEYVSRLEGRQDQGGIAAGQDPDAQHEA